jgi:aminocarboxymuconate-semialdehyde decarboxylase
MSAAQPGAVADLHCHIFPAAAAAQAGTSIVVEPEAGGWRYHAGSRSMLLDDGLYDLNLQLQDMQRQGVARRALCVPPFTLGYDLPPDEGARWTRAINDGIAEVVAVDPKRFVGFAALPLQDLPAALRELERAAGQLGLRGVEISSDIAGTQLDAEELEPFWERCAALRLPVLVHPTIVPAVGRMCDYYLSNLVGNPMETTIAGARLLFGGVLERHPDLRVILAHGGGALPHIVGRLRHGYAARPEARLRARDPIVQLRRLYFDTVVFDHGVLRHIVETAGASQVVVGTDYPFDMGEPDPVGFIRGAGLSQEATETILGNGERLLREALP